MRPVTTTRRRFSFIASMIVAVAMAQPGVADEADAKKIDVAPQRLSSALQNFSEQSGLQVAYVATLADNINSKGTRDASTPASALSDILDSTGLEYQFINAGTVAIRQIKTANREAEEPGKSGTMPGSRLMAQAAETQPTNRSPQPSSLSGSEDTNPTVEEIIVTARKREERVAEIPATVQVFDRARLTELGVSALVDLQTTIPNFFYTTIRPFETPVTMRGLGAPTGGVPGVGLYIDGAYQVDPAAFTLPFYDVERVEVLKGPQGTLYGRNSMAGAINYITRTPSDRFEADLFAEGGNGDTFKGSVSLAGPLLGSDIISGRITAGSQRQNGFRDFLDGTDADFDDYDAVNVRLVVAPGDRFSADLKLSYVDKTAGAYLYHAVSDLNDGNGVLRLTAPFLEGPFAGTYQRSENEHKAAALRLTYSTSAFDFASTSTYDESENFVIVDIDNGELDLVHSSNFFKRDTFSQELRLNSAGEGPLDWLVGAYYTEGTSPVGTADGFFVKFPTFNVFLPTGEGKFDGYAVFADAEYELNDHWVIGAGIRYDSIDKTQVVPATNALLSDTFSSTQPKLTVQYRFTEDKQVYITAAKGFREGGFNAALVGTEFESFPKEEVWSYEAGVKSTVANGRGYVELAGFYIDVEQFNGSGFVINPILNVPSIVTIPVGKIESYGVELSTFYQFTDSFSVSLNGGYNAAEPTELSSTIQPGQAIVDEQLQNAPRWNVQLTPRLDIPLSDAVTLGLLASLSQVGPTNFRGETSGGGPQLYEREEFSLIDLRASLEWRNYSVSAFVKNATDEVFPTSFLPFSLIAPFGATTAASLYNQPRYYGISFHANFANF